MAPKKLILLTPEELKKEEEKWQKDVKEVGQATCPDCGLEPHLLAISYKCSTSPSDCVIGASLLPINTSRTISDFEMLLSFLPPPPTSRPRSGRMSVAQDSGQGDHRVAIVVCATSFVFYSLAAASSITQGLNCVACRVGGRVKATAVECREGGRWPVGYNGKLDAPRYCRYKLVRARFTSILLDFHRGTSSPVQIIERNRGPIKFLDLARSSSIFLAGFLTGLELGCGPGGMVNLIGQHSGTKRCEDAKKKRDKQPRKNGTMLSFLSAKVPPVPPTVRAPAAVARLPIATPKADETSPLSPFSGDPTAYVKHDVAPEMLWEELGPIFRRAFGYGQGPAEREGMIHVGPHGQGGFMRFMDYFVTQRGLQGAMVELKLEQLLETHKFVLEKHGVPEAVAVISESQNISPRVVIDVDQHTDLSSATIPTSAPLPPTESSESAI
ncbi:hypothetical protein B0H13DRAFT_2299138 [Mycena leptocephala]|nr:hypothetical protein B0H13DRAFT_2299138 [Mycena leptocephala]